MQIAHYSSNDGYFWMTNRSTGQNVIENALFWYARLNKSAKCSDRVVFDGLKNWYVHQLTAHTSIMHFWWVLLIIFYGKVTWVGASDMGQARVFLNTAACGWVTDPYDGLKFCLGSQQSAEYSTFIVGQTVWEESAKMWGHFWNLNFQKGGPRPKIFGAPVT